MITDKNKAKEAFERLLNIMDDLRTKCPWDIKQNNQTLSYLTIEETFELVDALREEDNPEIKKELGDLLLHIVFYSKIGEEKDAFTITEVINSICEKLIYRHPHIYGDTKVKDEKEVLANWEKLKLKEKKNDLNKSILSGVPKSLPSLVKALRIQEKVKGVGFDWTDINDVKNKVKEELNELEEEVALNNKDAMESEFGDVLFSLINYGRHLGINPENALVRTNKKFIDRFQLMEKMIDNDHLDITNMSFENLDSFWDKAKEKSK